MKIKLLWAAIVLLLVVNMVSYYKIQEYKDYHQAAEKLLDKLDVEYDWVDAFDPQDYYEAASKLRK
jgi:uncharacterized membrane protein